MTQQLGQQLYVEKYRAEFDKKSLLLNIYVTADGKYEQYMVEDQL